MIKTLCEKKRTRVLKGFKGKKPFSTALTLDEEYKIKFDFKTKA
nr:topoisomerase C-terminal repeat-containing protein [Thalassobacillus sp. CUG 92003]